MTGQINGTALAAMSAGAVFLYGGIKGKSPLAALQAIVKGGSVKGVPVSQVAAASAGTSLPGGGTGPAGFVTGGGGGTNKDIAKMMMSRYGWSSADYTALVSLWDRESGWSAIADTRQTGAGGDGPGSSVFAYGIAQARPATKYPLAGRPPDLGGHSDPTTQITWGLEYIHSRYGSPSAAWQHELANNWY